MRTDTFQPPREELPVEATVTINHSAHEGMEPSRKGKEDLGLKDQKRKGCRGTWQLPVKPEVGPQRRREKVEPEAEKMTSLLFDYLRPQTSFLV